MAAAIFRALWITEEHDGRFARAVIERRIDALPAHDVLVRVHYSSLNYKDALSAAGHRGVTRRYPHTPGVDAAGRVAQSRVDAFRPGEEVIITGRDLGMNTPGGLAEYVRVPADWVVPLPAGLSLREAMILGTAGFTAALCVEALRDGGVEPDRGSLLVTGATGGVGSTAVSLLAHLGYTVVAATGKADRHGWLRDLGAADVIRRDDVLAPPERLLLRGAWAGVVDTVGGAYLDSALRATAYGGVVAACGMVASPQLETNVFPFILRGVRLQGIDSAECSLETRRRIWSRLAGDWKPAGLEERATEIGLEDVSDCIDEMLAGRSRGRVVVGMGVEG